jgi:hypothetical protein
MTQPSSYESLFQENHPIVGVLDDFYSEAYAAYFSGDNLIAMSTGISGRTEVIGLNPKDNTDQVDNVRFLVSGGSPDFRGLTMEINQQSMGVKYFVAKLTLAPDNKTPIQELDPSKLNMVTMLFVGEDGRVADGCEWFNEEEINELTGLLNTCELAQELPMWAQEDPAA